MPCQSRFVALGAAAVGGALAHGLLFASPGSSAGRHLTAHPQPSLRASTKSSTKTDSSSGSASVAVVPLGIAAAAACSRKGRKASGGAKALRPSAGSTPPTALHAAMVTAEVKGGSTMSGGFRLSGIALEATMKMQCDFSGADYAIYWISVDGELSVAKTYMKPGASDKLGQFVKETEPAKMPTSGCFGPESTVYNVGQSCCLQDVANDDRLLRKDLATECGVKSICFSPCGGGIIEYGTTGTEWMETAPEFPVLPKERIRTAFEDLGASFVVLWALRDGEFSPVADFSVDGWEKYCVESRTVKLPADGQEPVAETAKLGIEMRVSVDEGSTMQRKALAQEVGLKSLHHMPCEVGVLECGMSDDRLDGVTLEAALKMRCQSAGSCYALYWSEKDGMYSVASTYVTPERRQWLHANGLETDFADASTFLSLSINDDALVTTCARFGTPTFVQNARATPTFCRQALAQEYGIESIVCKPVKGGVLEFGTSIGPESDTWPAMPPVPDLPKGEMKKALEDMGGDYVAFWQLEGDSYKVTADFAKPAHEKSLGGEGSFADLSKQAMQPADGDGKIAVAARSGKEFLLSEGELPHQKGMREVHVVPCKDGVLEYGMAA